MVITPGVARPLGQLSEGAPQRKVAFTIPLTAEPDSEMGLASLELDILSDGTRMLRGRTVPKFRSANETFYFMVEPLKGTYRTTLRRSTMEHAAGQSLPEVAPMEKTHAISEVRPMGGQGGPPPSLPEPGDDCGCTDQCVGSWGASVATLDPAAAELTNTFLTAQWSISGTTMCQWHGSAHGSCAAANPSQFGTHWYTSYCDTYGPSISWKYLDAYQVGNYYNFDFGLPNEGTDVTQTVRIQVSESGGVFYDWSHADWGDFSWIIYGSFAQSGFDSCF